MATPQLKTAQRKEKEMEYLKEVLGEELFKQFEEAIGNYNGNEENKNKQIKLGNLANGEYVGKGKFDALNEQLNGKQTELDSANKLIDELKKATKDNENIQGKVGAYETQIAELQKQLAENSLKAAVKVALLEAKANDIDYLTFKLNEGLKTKGEELELDENGSIKGWDGRLEDLKTQFPTQFGSSEEGYKPLGQTALPNGGNSAPTRADILKMTYAERVNLYENNPEAYESAMHK